MRQKLFATIIFISAYLPAHSQARIEKNWGGKGNDAAISAAATADGGYILSGLTQSGPDTIGDIIVIKTNAHADTMWTLKVGGPLLEGGNSVIQTSDGGFMVSGHTEDFGAKDCDAFLMKLDKSGTKQWLRVYGGDEDDISESALELPGSGYVIAGITASYGFGGNRHTWFIRMDYNGDTLWTRCYGGQGTEYAESIARVPGNGFLAAGFSTSYSGSFKQGWLLRLKDNGDTLWTRLSNSTGDSRYHQILALRRGGYIITGYTNTSVPGKSLGLAIKLDADGAVIWEKSYGSLTENMELSGVTELSDGKLIFSGTTWRVDPAGNAYTLTIDANGEKISDALYGAPGSFAACITAQANNSYLIGGRTPVPGDQEGNLYYVAMDRTIAGIPPLHEESPCLYPNPCEDVLTIILPATLANQSNTCTIYDAQGRLAATVVTEAGKDIQVNSGNLNPGYYTYRLSAKDGRTFSGSFLVVHD